ncbi:hypothetical protein [Methylobacterium sp. A54F]
MAAPMQNPDTTDIRPRAAGPRTAKAKFGEVVLVCRKCAKRQRLGRGDLRSLVKDAAKRAQPRRRVRVLETGCLGPCPKRLVAVATGASVAAGRIVLLDPAATPEAVAAALLPDFGPKAGLAADAPV